MAAIEKLTSDDLREPSREVSELARLNALITVVNAITANGTAPTVAGTVITATAGTGLRSLLNALDTLGLINDTTTDA